MTLADHVRTLGRGPGRSRSLTQAEATDAMVQMLSRSAAREAIGALLMLLRMKGETAEEIAGFASAARAALPAMPHVDLDWPSYAAGRTRGAPWFLLSARLVADSGHSVLLHGWNGTDVKVRAGLDVAGIPVLNDLDRLDEVLSQRRIAYLPLERFFPQLFNLLDLRSVLGLRSCINTVCRMLNPAGAAASVQGVFHPSYRELQADAAALMGWRRLSVIKGGGGEFERHPGKDIQAFGLRDGTAWQDVRPAVLTDVRRMSDTSADLERVWSGRDHDPFATSIVTGTAALALDTLGVAQPARRAAELWCVRTHRAAA